MPLNHVSPESLPQFLEHRDTLTAPLPEQIDRWRAWHPTVQLNPIVDSARLGFNAQLVRYRAPDGIMFGFAKCDGMESRFGKANLGDYFLAGTVISGTGVALGGRAELSLDVGNSIYIVDGRRPACTRVSSEFSHLYALLPRVLVVDAVGGDSFTRRQPILNLGNQGLLAMANSALRTLWEQIATLSQDEFADALQVLSGLIVLGLKARYRHPGEMDRPDLCNMLVSTARRVMEAHYADRQLTASMIAAAIGCSRANLYRAFARNGTTIGGVLREIRMTKAKSLLVGARRRSLAEVAALTGYADQSSFSHAFNATTGMAPQKWRRLTVDQGISITGGRAD